MRPVTAISCLLLAAVGGGVTARLLTPSPIDPTPAANMMQRAADLALPERAWAAPPAAVGEIGRAHV